MPVSGSSFATKAGFVLDAARPVCVLAETFEEAQRAIRGLHSVAFFDIPGYVLGGGDERTEPVGVDELEELIAAGVTVIDVREEDERETGTIPGSLGIPYRLVGGRRPSPRTGRSSRSARAAPAPRSPPACCARRGYDARPVVDGGLAEWRPRGGELVVSGG